LEEAQPGAATSFRRQAAGKGPTAAVQSATRRRTPLAPYLATFALLLLVAAVLPVELTSRGLQWGAT